MAKVGLILTEYNTGSSFLCDCLDNHQHITSDLNAFSNMPFYERAIAIRLMAKEPFRFNYQVSRIFYNDLTSYDWSNLRVVARRHKIKIIHLSRQSKWKQALSYLISTQLLENDKFPLLINIDKFDKVCHYLDKSFKQMRHQLKEVPHLSFTYEEMTHDANTNFINEDLSDRICSLLQVRSVILRSDKEKNVRAFNKEHIINFDQLHQHILRKYDNSALHN